MSADLDTLWTLHGLDESVAQLRASLEKFPGLKRELDGRVDSDRAKLESQKKAVTEFQAARRKIEQEIESVLAQQRKFESQQPSVKTNEEYHALTKEITACKSKRSELETQVLVKYEEEEHSNASRPALEAALKASESERAAKLSAIEAEERALQARLEAAEAERAAALAELSPATRGRYERIHASRDGRAVVAIVKGSCGGCFRGQPPQLLQEAKRRDRLLTCDGCGRLLVMPPEGVHA
jgi:predicted  nucleic acid-binding Zn-ribbon protein